MSTGRMMSMCEHAKIYGKCEVCLRAEVERLERDLQGNVERFSHVQDILVAERDDYKSQLDELVNATILGPLKGKTAHDEIVALRAERLELRRSLFELIELANERSDVYTGEAYQKVRDAKELIRCSVQGCGLGGACNGKGLPEYPCPLRIP
jgi:hypothetical protein